MIKYIIGGFVILALMTIVPSCSEENNKKEIVLGQEMARASEKEKERIKSGNFEDSPMPDFNYMKWPNERSLINPIENELDLSIRKLCLKFKKYKEGKRNKVRRSISQDEIYTLMTFCKRNLVGSKPMATTRTNRTPKTLPPKGETRSTHPPKTFTMTMYIPMNKPVSSE